MNAIMNAIVNAIMENYECNSECNQRFVQPCRVTVTVGRKWRVTVVREGKERQRLRVLHPLNISV